MRTNTYTSTPSPVRLSSWARGAILLSLPALILPALLLMSPGSARANVTEPSSGQSFVENLGSQALLGVGIRKKWGFKVYAIGLYGDKAAASKLSAGDYNGVIRGTFPKTVELRMLRNVGADKVRSVFEDSLAGPTGKSAEYQQFLSYFQGELPKGTRILLKTNGPTLNVVVGGSAKPPINSAKLTGALLNVWLGPKPVDGSLKKNLISRLGSL